MDENPGDDGVRQTLTETAVRHVRQLCHQVSYSLRNYFQCKKNRLKFKILFANVEDTPFWKQIPSPYGWVTKPRYSLD